MKWQTLIFYKYSLQTLFYLNFTYANKVIFSQVWTSILHFYELILEPNINLIKIFFPCAWGHLESPIELFQLIFLLSNNIFGCFEKFPRVGINQNEKNEMMKIYFLKLKFKNSTEKKTFFVTSKHLFGAMKKCLSKYLIYIYLIY